MDYSKITNFATKDTLPSGNSGKIVKGTEIDDEFNAISSAIASKANLGSPSFTGTPTAPTATVGSNTLQLATTAFVTAAVGALVTIPPGLISLWSGSIVTIPSGWYLCDGSNSTPDLRNKFIVGAGSTYAVGATGGSTDAIVPAHSHTATVTDPGHSHSTDAIKFNVVGSGIPDAVSGSTYRAVSATINSTTTGISVSNSTTGSSGTNANLPPYYALAYIIKA